MTFRATAPPNDPTAFRDYTLDSFLRIQRAFEQAAIYDEGGTGSVARSILERLRDRVSVKDYGAVCDGVTDDTAAVQKAINTRFLRDGGGDILVEGRCLIDGTLDVLQNVTLVGGNSYLDFTDRDWWGQTRSTLIVNSSATIQLRNGAGLKGLVLYRKGMVFPATGLTAAEVALYEGTAITVLSASPYIGYCAILGFERAIDTGTNNTPRGRVEFVNIDCTNGIRVDQDLGAWNFQFVQCAPLLSNSDADNVRSGVGFEFRNRSDWTTLVGCFAFNEIGYSIVACNQIKMFGCGADSPTDGTDTYHTGVGFRFRGASTDCMLVGCQTASHLYGVDIDIADADRVYLTDLHSWNIHSTNGIHVRIIGGDVSILGGRFAEGNKGVVIDNPNSNVTLAGGTHFFDVTNALDSIDYSSLVISPDIIIEGATTAHANEKLTEIASAATITIPNNEKMFQITGTTDVGLISPGSVVLAGTIVTLIFESALTLNHGNTLLDGSADLAVTAGSSVTLQYITGNTWREIGRNIA